MNLLGNKVLVLTFGQMELEKLYQNLGGMKHTEWKDVFGGWDERQKDTESGAGLMLTSPVQGPAVHSDDVDQPTEIRHIYKCNNWTYKSKETFLNKSANVLNVNLEC